MKTVRTTFDRQEGRRDRRYPLPTLVLTLAREGVWQTADWSLGGFRIADYDGPITTGARLEGTLRILGAEEQVDFVAEIVRRDRIARDLGAAFYDRSRDLVTLLDNALARRLTRGR